MEGRSRMRGPRRTRALRIGLAVLLTAVVLVLAGSLDAVAGRGHGGTVAGLPGGLETSARSSSAPAGSPGPTPPAIGDPQPTHTATPTHAPTHRSMPRRCHYVPFGQAARQVSRPSAQPVAATRLVLRLRIGTSPTLRSVVIALEPRLAPCAVNSVYHLSRAHFYDRTPCPRLTTRRIYVLQCGDPTGTGYGGPGYRFRDEVPANPRYPAGTVAMATSVPNTNGSQFFIVYRRTSLRPRFSVIGHVVSGFDAITAVARGGARSVFADQDGPPRLAVRIVSARASCGAALHPAQCPVRTLPQ